MLDLNLYKRTIAVKYREKIYEIKKVTVNESEFLHKIMGAGEGNSVEFAGEMLDFIVDRFRAVDPAFPEKEFRGDITFEELNAVLTMLLRGADGKEPGNAVPGG